MCIRDSHQLVSNCDSIEKEGENLIEKSYDEKILFAEKVAKNDQKLCNILKLFERSKE